MTYEIGLLKLNPNNSQMPYIIPSQVQGLRVGQQYQFSLGDLNSFPPKSLIGTRRSTICWNFKADLLHPASQKSYSMLGYSAVLKEGKPAIAPLEKSFSPHQISEEFIRALCEETTRRLRYSFDDTTELNFYFSTPGYDQQESGIYRNNIRSILRKINAQGSLTNVNFPQIQPNSGEQFLYEQYGVYYYFARCEPSLNSNQPEANYLIIDIGGSTTDIALVHLTKSGTIARTFPIYKSFQYGGSSFNEAILQELIRNRKVSDEYRSRLLQKIENAKIQVLENPQLFSGHFPIKMPDSTYMLRKERIDAAFEQYWNWTLKKCVLEVISEAVSDDRFTSDGKLTINSILLAGGGSQIGNFRAKLCQDPELKPYLAANCKAIMSRQAHPSSLAAIGLAISVAERVAKSKGTALEVPGELPTAEEIYFKLLDPSGQHLNIHRKSLGAGQNKSLLLTVRELRERITKRAKGAAFSIPEYTHHELTTLPASVNLEITTDCNPDPQSLNIPLSVPENTGRDKPEGLYFSLSVPEPSRLYDLSSTKLRLEPHFFQWLPINRKHRRCDRIDKTPKIDISLNAKSIQVSQEAVHVCIDFGMSNTSVAVFAPGRKLDPKHFLVLPIASPEESIQLQEVPDYDPVLIKQNQIEFEVPQSDADTQTFSEMDESSTQAAQTSLEEQAEQSQVVAEVQTSEELEDLPEQEEQTFLTDDDSPFSSKTEFESEGISTASLQTEELSELKAAITDLTQELRRYTEQTTVAIQALTEERNNSESASSSIIFVQSQEAAINLVASKSTKEFPDQYLEFKAFVASKGYCYQEDVLRKVWTQSINDNARLTVLAGPPGSGKTALVSLLAQFFHRDLPTAGSPSYDDFYLLQPVLPSWFSSENLLGFYSQISESFHPTEFLKFLQRSQFYHEKQVNRKFFACLDEFNLAQPEQYLAKVLSVIEASSRTMVVCSEMSEIVKLTPNLKLFATINTDAASKSLSPKVLDRAILIRVLPSKDQVLEYAQSRQLSTPTGQQAFNELIKLLDILFDLATAAGTSFSYRAIGTVCGYLNSHPYTDGSSPQLTNQQVQEVLDEIICSIFLSKLPGKNHFEEHESYGKNLKSVEEKFNKLNLPHSKNTMVRIRMGFPGQSAF